MLPCKNVNFCININCPLQRMFIRACLHEDGGPQIGEVTFGRSPHLTCKRDQIKIRDYIDRRVTPPQWVTAPTWGAPPPCKQALRVSCMMRSERRAGRVRLIKQVQTIAPWTWSLEYVFSRHNVLTDQLHFANVIDHVHKISTKLSTFQWKADSRSLYANGLISCIARKVNANLKSWVKKPGFMLGHLHSTTKCTRIRSRENLASQHRDRGECTVYFYLRNNII